MSVGTVAHHLGAGRQQPRDQINHAVGVELKSQVGDFLSRGIQFTLVFIITVAGRKKYRGAVNFPFPCVI